jgi:hypothetical protein
MNPFGICTRCEREIGQRRLQVIPWAALWLPDKRPQPDSFACRQHDHPRRDRRRSVRLS